MKFWPQRIFPMPAAFLLVAPVAKRYALLAGAHKKT